MKFSLTVIFFLLFLVVVAAYVYLVPSSGPNEKKTSSAVSRLLPLEDGDHIVSLEIENSANQEKIVFFKDENTWLIQSPIKGPADKLLVDGLQAALTLSAKARRLLPELSWQEYGLENPVLKIGVQTANEEKVKVLSFGDKSPVGDFVYARWEDEEEYFLLDPNLMRVFQRSAYSFRDKKIYRMDLRDIEKIRVQNDSEVYEIQRLQTGWFWAEPIEKMGQGIPGEVMDVVIASMRGLFIKDFLSDESAVSNKGFGVLAPETFLQMSGASGTLVETVRLGDELPVRDAFYARREEDGEVFLVSREKVGEVFAMFRDLLNSKSSDTAA